MEARTQARSNEMIMVMMANGDLQVLLVSAVDCCEALRFWWKMFFIQNALTNEIGPTSFHLGVNGGRGGLNALKTGNLKMRKGISFLNESPNYLFGIYCLV